MKTVSIISLSHASDLGYRALADVAAAGIDTDTTGNHYIRQDELNGEIIVDVLIPQELLGKVETNVINGRGFDAIPGLSFALSQSPLLVNAKVLFHDGSDLSFTVPVPDVQAALILKAIARPARLAALIQHHIPNPA
ncbi:hypothetical protein ACQR35_06775 [Pseudarthrobacter sp. J1738]|uniref:hypothetical protein n=1 Tax=Pseudarthrobacter sp. J1738 TaxID=3420446 RepID=UPI003D2CDA78